LCGSASYEKTAIQRLIKETDKQINQLVYKLYNLTDDEIRIVEEATKWVRYDLRLTPVADCVRLSWS
jgi:hypothetical protein